MTNKALEGIRVVEFGPYVALPLTGRILASLGAEELFHEGQQRNLVFIPVNDVADLLQDPQLEASSFWAELEHPEVGTLKYPLGIFYSDEVAPNRVAAPQLGQHNQAIYGDELGLTREKLENLRATGTI